MILCVHSLSGILLATFMAAIVHYKTVFACYTCYFFIRVYTNNRSDAVTITYKNVLTTTTKSIYPMMMIMATIEIKCNAVVLVAPSRECQCKSLCGKPPVVILIDGYLPTWLKVL